METKLLPVYDLGYKKHARSYANRSRYLRNKKGVDEIARDFQHQLRIFEKNILNWFSQLTDSKAERILRYKTDPGVLKYQEIDFIAQDKTDNLTFCELKLKSHYKSSMNQKESGLYQLTTTTQVAKSQYNIRGSLAICIDMSFLYEGNTTDQDGNYILIEDLPQYFKADSEKVIWINIKDVLAVGLVEGWIVQEEVTELVEAYLLVKNPFLYLPDEIPIPTNNPFSTLRHKMSASN